MEIDPDVLTFAVELPEFQNDIGSHVDSDIHPITVCGVGCVPVAVR
jgi:hypothetical protein